MKNLDQLAAALNAPVKAVQALYARGTLPRPDDYEAHGAPLWSDTEVEAAKNSAKVAERLAVERAREPSFVDQMSRER